jgi:FixJ family two-component response regulator
MLPDAALSQLRILRIAIVDDDPSVCEGLSRLARSHGIECTTFGSGEGALAFPDIGQADCLILDINLPGIDGFETRDRLEARGLQTPIIFITAHTGTGEAEWQRKLKGRHCLRKPFDESDLIDAICASRTLT